MWQLSETEDIWHCCEELYSVSCQPLRVTACQGGLSTPTPNLRLQSTIFARNPVFSEGASKPIFSFHFLWMSFLSMCLPSMHIWSHFSSVKKKSPISFWVLIISVNTGNIFCFTSFSRHLNLALGKAKFPREKKMSDIMLKTGQPKPQFISSNL